MIAFIDDHREAHGVEPICKVLPIAPSTYHAHVAWRNDPTKRSARAKRDGTLKPEIRRVFDDNFQVYGVRKVWRQLRRENHDVARCTVERLMRDMGLQGAARGKPVLRLSLGWVASGAEPGACEHEAAARAPDWPSSDRTLTPADRSRRVSLHSAGG